MNQLRSSRGVGEWDFEFFARKNLTAWPQYTTIKTNIIELHERQHK